MSFCGLLLTSKNVSEAARHINLSKDDFIKSAKLNGTVDDLRRKIKEQEANIKANSPEWTFEQLQVQQYQLNQLCNKMIQLGENW